MLGFFRVIYIVVVAVAEISLAFILMPVLGVIPTVAIEAVAFVVFMAIYVAVSRKLRL